METLTIDEACERLRSLNDHNGSIYIEVTDGHWTGHEWEHGGCGDLLEANIARPWKPTTTTTDPVDYEVAGYTHITSGLSDVIDRLDRLERAMNAQAILNDLRGKRRVVLEGALEDIGSSLDRLERWREAVLPLLSGVKAQHVIGEMEQYRSTLGEQHAAAESHFSGPQTVDREGTE